MSSPSNHISKVIHSLSPFTDTGTYVFNHSTVPQSQISWGRLYLHPIDFIQVTQYSNFIKPEPFLAGHQAFVILLIYPNLKPATLCEAQAKLGKPILDV